jgi:hypothetical protein
MDGWIPIAIVILLSVLVVDLARAHRAVPAMLNTMRGRSRSGRRPRGE